MKPQDLHSQVDTNLLHTIKTNPEFVRSGKNYVFIWNDDTLEMLLKAMKRANVPLEGDIEYARTPEETIGVGVFNPQNSSVAVGSLNPDDISRVNVFSSISPSKFFNQVDHKINKLFFDLEKLGKIAKTSKPKEKNVSGSTVDRIVNYMVDVLDVEDEELAQEFIDQFIKDGDTAEEIQKSFEDAITKLRHQSRLINDRLPSYRDKIQQLKDTGKYSQQELRAMLRKMNSAHQDEIDQINDLSNQTIMLSKLLRNPDLFVDGDESSEPDEHDDKNSSDGDLDSWLHDFLADYPGLEVDDATEFIPPTEY